MKRITIIVLSSLMLILGIKFWPKKSNQSDYEKVLHLALVAQVQKLDPVLCDSTYERSLIDKVYEGLVEYHYLKRPFEVTENLAEAMPLVSEDGLTYTFKIKPGVYFHDNICFPDGQGREVTAEDFVYSFKRIADPAVQSPFFNRVEALIKGMGAFHAHLNQHAGDYNAPIEGIQAIDRYTLQFTLKAPSSLLLHYLTYAFTNVVAKEAVDYYGPGFINHPVGTGPFTLEQFNPQSNKIVLNKNKRFRDKFFPEMPEGETDELREAAGRKLPFVDKIIYHTLFEAQPRWLEFKGKKIDCISFIPDYIPEVFKDKQLHPELRQAGVTLLAESSPRVFYIGFNCFQKPLDNRKLRQAMSLAFDRNTFKEIFTDNLADIQHSFIPSSFVGYKETFRNPYATYDLEKAKQYLAEAGYPNGDGLPTFTLETNDNSTFKHQMDFFSKCMKKIGIKVEVNQQIFPELIKKLYGKHYMLAFLGEWMDYPDAAAILGLVRDPSISSAINIVDPVFNQLFDQAVQTLDPACKAERYAQLDALATELTPALLLPVSMPDYVLTNKRVKYYRVSPYNFRMEQYVDVA